MSEGDILQLDFEVLEPPTRSPTPSTSPILRASSIIVSLNAPLRDLHTSPILSLNQGLENLYSICEQHAPDSILLPRNVPLTSIPFIQIAEILSSIITTLQTSLSTSCAQTTHLQTSNTLLRTENHTLSTSLDILHGQFSRQSLSPRSLRIRLAANIDEIRRINSEKESAIQVALDMRTENEELKQQIREVSDCRRKAKRLEKDCEWLSQRNRELKGDLKVASARVRRLEWELESAKWREEMVPRPVRGVFEWGCVPRGRDQGEEKKEKVDEREEEEGKECFCRTIGKNRNRNRNRTQRSKSVDSVFERNVKYERRIHDDKVKPKSKPKSKSKSEPSRVVERGRTRERTQFTPYDKTI